MFVSRIGIPYHATSEHSDVLSEWFELDVDNRSQVSVDLNEIANSGTLVVTSGLSTFDNLMAIGMRALPDLSAFDRGEIWKVENSGACVPAG